MADQLSHSRSVKRILTSRRKLTSLNQIYPDFDSRKRNSRLRSLVHFNSASGKGEQSGVISLVCDMVCFYPGLLTSSCR